MGPAFFRKYATLTVTGTTAIRIPIVKRGVVDFAVGADWTPAAGDVKIAVDGAAAANVTNLPTAVAMGNTAFWQFILTAAEVTGKSMVVTVADSATKAVEDQSFVVETFGHASAMYIQDFSASRFDANMTGIDGQNTNGYNATLKLKMIDISNNAGDAFSAISTGSNGRGFFAKGHVDGAGGRFEGGSAGDGLECIGPYVGLWCVSQNFSNGIYAQAAGSAHGFHSVGSGAGDGAKYEAGATGIGFETVGGGTSGEGMLSRAIGNGAGIKAQAGGGTSVGFHAYSAAGHGALYESAAVAGANGLKIIGFGVGDGLLVQSGAGATGNGAKFEALSINGRGLYGIGTGTRAGIHGSAAGTGPGMAASSDGGGPGFEIVGTGGPGLVVISATAEGILTTGAAGFQGFKAKGGANASGALFEGSGTGHGLSLVKGGGGGSKDVDSDQTDDIALIKAVTDNFTFGDSGVNADISDEPVVADVIAIKAVTDQFTFGAQGVNAEVTVEVAGIASDVLAIKAKTDQLAFEGGTGNLKVDLDSILGSNGPAGKVQGLYDSIDAANDWIRSNLSAIGDSGPKMDAFKNAINLVESSVQARVEEMEPNVLTASALAADAVTEIQSGLATSAALALAQADLDDIQARLPATLDGGLMRSQVKGMDADTLTASALAGSAVAEIEVYLAGLHGAGAWDAVGGAATLADNATNKDIIAKSMKTQDVSAFAPVAGSIVAYNAVYKNVRLMSITYNSQKNPLTMTFKMYPTSADATADTNAIGTFSVIHEYNSNGTLKSRKVTG